ncbi:hypothetical protein BJ944DRAFT_246886 [Cunninghamella echinulata]|nr:hypothetical protein BJ944DRAFT_246886 [Cunninghamella echinulata]
MSNIETISTQKKKEITEMDQVAPLNKNILRLIQPRDSATIINENNNINISNNNNKNRSSSCSNSYRRSNEEDDHIADEYRISDSDMTCHDSDIVYPLPFLVRARTIEEKEAIRNEYRNSLPQSRSQTIYNKNDDDNDDDNNNGPPSKQEKEPRKALFQFIDKWYRRLSASKLLENKASVARDHLGI